jgi:hypothetical protein
MSLNRIATSSAGLVLAALERLPHLHHHARRLRQLGADEGTINDLVASLLPQAEPELQEQTSPDEEQIPPEEEVQNQAACEEDSDSNQVSPARDRRPPVACLGALGFRARVTREQYSNIKDLRATPPTKERPRVRRGRKAKPH